MKTVVFFAGTERCLAESSRLEGFARVARRKGWQVETVPCTAGLRTVREAVEFWRPIGAIVGTGRGTEKISQTTLGGIPAVYFDERPRSKGPGVYVSLDCAEVGRVAADELLRLGFEDYAYVDCDCPAYWSREREAAFAAAVKSAGKTLRPAFAGRKGESSMNRRRRLVRWLNALPRPCGVFAANDEWASEVLAVAARESLSVPEDLAVVGVDNHPAYCALCSPTLTSVAVDFKEAAYLSMKLLAEQIEKPSRRPSSKCVTYGTLGIVRRGSTTLLARMDARIVRARDFIRENAGTGLAVDDVVAAANCSRRSLEAAFRKATGLSLLAAINARRRELAIGMLTEGKITRGIIADRLGVSRSTLDRLLAGA